MVEDNPDAAEALKMVLEMFGHRVRVAHDGPAALEAVRAESPTVALVDLGLPGMDGYELVRRLRAQPGMEGTTLVAVSGYGRDEDKKQALAAGFHLTSPSRWTWMVSKRFWCTWNPPNPVLERGGPTGRRGGTTRDWAITAVRQLPVGCAVSSPQVRRGT